MFNNNNPELEPVTAWRNELRLVERVIV
jgi:hypothetical protein